MSSPRAVVATGLGVGCGLLVGGGDGVAVASGLVVGKDAELALLVPVGVRDGVAVGLGVEDGRSVGEGCGLAVELGVTGSRVAAG